MAEPAPGLVDRRVEITGPTDRKMTINALNSGAKVWLADQEDANTPHWGNVVSGPLNLGDAIAGTIDFTSPEGKDYKLRDLSTTIVVRPRGWHLPEKHILVDGEQTSGSLVDFALHLVHNTQALLDAGKGPYFYLPKMESHLEARLWNDAFVAAQEFLGLPRGTIRATVLIETYPAAFEMEEILYELREHSAGLNAGRWDYLFSVIKKFRTRGRDFMLPDRNSVTMTAPFMRAYTELLVRTCHKRGAHAIGGMAAFIPNRRDAEVTEVAMQKVREDKTREANDGFDGSWVAHPDMVALCREVFDSVLGDRPNQIDRKREEVHVTAEQLLDVAATPGEITEAGLRNDISVGLQYLESWLRGGGAVAIFNLMEDAATAEIARSQVWQWLHNDVTLADGQKVTRELVERIIDEELAKVRRRVPAAGGTTRRRCSPRWRCRTTSPSSSPCRRTSGCRRERCHGRSLRARVPPAGGAGCREGDRRPAGAAHVRVRRARPLQGRARAGRAGRDHRRRRRGGHGLRRGRRAVRRPRLRHRPVRRGPAARRRRARRHLADAHDHRGRPGRPARGGRAGRDQPARHPGRRAQRLLLRARPVQPAGLLDRRQRRGELGRRALPEVRLHHQPRARRRVRRAVRRGGRDRRQGPRPARLRPARRDRRLGGHARHRDQGDGPADPGARSRCRRCWPASTAPTRRARRSRRSSPPA